MTNSEVLVGLNKVGSIGSVRLKALLDYFEKPQAIIEAPLEKLRHIAGLDEVIAGKIKSLKARDISVEFKLAEKLKLDIITQEDADYPENLKNIPGAPIVLYIKGKLEELDRFAVGIVGSRQPSFYGLSNAEKFAQGLAESGFTVVSGMARGIDTASHKGALKQKGRTIAVMGSGFGEIYPAENKKLAEQIADSGAVISEFAITMPPLKENFPRRNRIVSGLSLGILVVEAAKNSGALITADFALEQGREVFALPGKIDSPLSQGANALIKQGAKLVSCVEEILEEFSSPLKKLSVIEPVKDELSRLKLSEEEAVLYELLSEGIFSWDEIVEKTRFDVNKLSQVILGLQLKRLIRQLPGRQLKRN